MKVPTTSLIGIQIQDLELRDCDRIAELQSQLKWKYETVTADRYTDFILNLEYEISDLLKDPQLDWEPRFIIWEDQRIVREAIVNDYYDQLIP
jgi:hypothetical protein